MSKIEETIIDIGKDVLVSLVILGIILGSLYAFSGRWPPMVVIESGSMMHSEESQIGVIDPGDIVVVQESDKEDITTYVEGKSTGYKRYGQYGDVIVFEPDGNEQTTPIIHRPVLYLEENDSGFDAPSLDGLEYGEEWNTTDEGNSSLGLTGTITIYDYGFDNKDVEIDLSSLRHSGYITKGDNNPNIDQAKKGRNAISSETIKEEWILGRARGEFPWFGIIKLTFIGRTEYIPRNSLMNFGISVGVILLFPIITEVGSKIYYEMSDGESKKETDKGSSKDTEEKENSEITSTKTKKLNRNRRDFGSESSKESEE
ncbi:MAG: S26 family signal peptidase [Candidatus Thermoplasmatota archaeon]|nr:S26 family signal peptidase [Candidatus Thermoplasmatota archaeon]MBS3789337.1 S26 family signal peptidase [Candidatus Thermoplasmatota archaeon]